MYPEDAEETRVIEGSMNMGYLSDTARTCSIMIKQAPILLDHSDEHWDGWFTNAIFPWNKTFYFKEIFVKSW